jgi:predicted ATP-binding protein involved in virulence
MDTQQQGLNFCKFQNYRGFPDFSIHFDPQCTVIVASNGAGKTAILDGIASLLRVFLNVVEGKEQRPILSPFDIHRKQNPDLLMEMRFPCFLRVLYNFGEDFGIFLWSLVKSSEEQEEIWPTSLVRQLSLEDYFKSSNAAHHLRDKAQMGTPSQEDNPVKLPVFAYYGTQRLWDTRKIAPDERKDPTPNARLRGYRDCLQPSARYASFVHWFKRYSSEAISRPNSPHKPKERLACVQNAIQCVLANQGIDDIAWDFVEETVVAKHRSRGTLPVDAMSDGIRTMIGLVGDLAHRTAILNPHLGAEAARETEGLVLIDEVDLHLHPDWQQSIVMLLREAFPKVQFVMTTHSPQVLSTVHASSIRILRVDEEGETHVTTPTQQTRGVESPDVMAAVMGIDPLPDVPEARLMKAISRL